jgi:hypothetical protein
MELALRGLKKKHCKKRKKVRKNVWCGATCWVLSLYTGSGLSTDKNKLLFSKKVFIGSQCSHLQLFTLLNVLNNLHLLISSSRFNGTVSCVLIICLVHMSVSLAVFRHFKSINLVENFVWRRHNWICIFILGFFWLDWRLTGIYGLLKRTLAKHQFIINTTNKSK